MFAPPKALIRPSGGKIVLLVIDGLGGLPDPEKGSTELEAASLPNLDGWARESSVGRVSLLPPGLTPGSGPGHLALFGYDPMTIDFGRGVLEALGSNHPLATDEVAARGNFCSMDARGIVTDRRAGRPTDEENRRLCQQLTEQVSLGSDASFLLLPGKQHRFTLVLKGEGLGHAVNDNDPQVEGKASLPFVGRDEASRRTAGLATQFLEAVRDALADHESANGVLLRGFSSRPDLETFGERYGLRAAAIAIYPMYGGVARLVGMEVQPPGRSLSDQIGVARERWEDFDFFFIHTKQPDQAGHSGDFDAKVAALEEIDRAIPELRGLGADVSIVTGDHSTPTVHLEHSWHAVPTLIHSNRTLPIPDMTFDERAVLRGDLGTFPAQALMTLALAHAGRLDKFGA
ncbi:MAG: 2,3-bisphosphoglycerate-independent phosphoglycerate mutase [Planctomycetes bacterium]|nr:2,3-bisphosphoglycerate-independent phosphoglycerate mutase [Planctomycetota bacterium]